ncbi:MAG: hypothetical protein FWG56_00320 [Desulfovibrionaceae bacterium]|nr:hypothetical protein [Desulfovibrionaceae bacterium]
MNEQDSMDLISKIAFIVEQFQRNCNDVTQNVSNFAAKTPGMVREEVQKQLNLISDEAAQQVHNGLNRPVATYEKYLSDSASRVQAASDSLAGRMERVEALLKFLIWKVAAVVVAILALATGGAIWISQYYINEIRDNQISADLLKAYNQADVTLCDGRLCAKVNKKYVPVELRR